MTRLAIILSIFAMLAGACVLQDPRTGLDIDNILSLEAPSDTILANGRDRMIITATLADDLDANLSVTFKTTEGSFLENGDNVVTVTASGKVATATLVAGRIVEPASLITATVTGFIGNSQDPSDFTASLLINQAQAAPNRMLLSTEDPVIPATKSDAGNIVVELIRDFGEVSFDIPVELSVVPVDTSQAQGQITPFLIVNDKVASTQLRSATRDTGLVWVIAEVNAAGGGTLRDSVQVEFQ